MRLCSCDRAAVGWVESEEDGGGLKGRPVLGKQVAGSVIGCQSARLGNWGDKYAVYISLSGSDNSRTKCTISRDQEPGTRSQEPPIICGVMHAWEPIAAAGGPDSLSTTPPYGISQFVFPGVSRQ